MRKLTETEEWSLQVLRTHGPCGPLGDERSDHELRRVLDSLVKKKRATVEMTDDGPRYHAAP